MSHINLISVQGKLNNNWEAAELEGQARAAMATAALRQSLLTRCVAKAAKTSGATTNLFLFHFLFSLISETQLAHVIEISRSQIPCAQMLAGESTHVAASSSSSSSWSGRPNVQLVGLQHKRNSVKNACKPRQWQVSCQSATSTGTVVTYPRAFVNSKFTEAKMQGDFKEGACHMSLCTVLKEV